MEEREITETGSWALTTGRPVYSISELTGRIKLILELELSDIWAEGEISNLRIPSSGHTYFTLKDESSQIKAILFKYQKRGLKFKLEDGLKVIVRGRITVYEPRGEYQIIIDYVEPKGVGALQLAFQQLKDKLAQEGLFDPEHKKPLPLLPQKIGIVTSPTGAAIRDILRVIQRRFANVHLILYPARVQGAGASKEIAEGIRVLNQFLNIDVLIVGRGGGSVEDLWAFNEEEVARAIFVSRIPVISAVGHEIDFTISDFVADLRAPTPSAAAELVVKNKEEILFSVQTLHSRLRNRMGYYLDFLKDRFQRLSQQKGFSIPQEKIQYYQQRVDELQARVTKTLPIHLKNKKEYLAHLCQRHCSKSPKERTIYGKDYLERLFKGLIDLIAYRLMVTRKNVEGAIGKLNSLSPLAILARGYSICHSLPSGRVVKESGELKEGQKVSIKLYRGELFCQVEKTKLEEKQDNDRAKI
jgi:exodeoxyribonuclease VII large subunit